MQAGTDRRQQPGSCACSDHVWAAVHPAQTRRKPLQGGNDFEIFTSDETVGHTVTSPDDTRKMCTELFMS